MWRKEGKKIRKVENKIILVLLVSFLLVFWQAATVPSLELKQVPKPGPSTEELKKPSGLRPPPCPDLKANLTMRARTAGNQGIIELHGQICNVGTADYNSTVGATAKLEATDPSTGVTRLLRNIPFNSLAKGGCVDMTFTYTIDQFVKWGEERPQQRACRGERVFKMSARPNSPQRSQFPLNEDCVPGNNFVVQDARFWVECPQ